ncbi:MAG: type II CAAX endopeptidase family protein [Cyanobacteria bacterium J06621_8]
MTIKRAILTLLSILAIAQVSFSLKDSLAQPQIQSRLELYQTNLVLHVAELTSLPSDDFQFAQAVSSLVGENPYAAASQKYLQVRQESVTSRNNFSSQLEQLDNSEAEITDTVNAAQKQQLQQQIFELEKFINEVDLKQGILTAVQSKPQEALSLWSEEIKRINNPQDPYVQTAKVLMQLWQGESQELNFSLETINRNLDSWFRYQTLAKLNQLLLRQENLAVLQQQELQIARNSLIKLAVISGIPLIGGIGGAILLILLIVQRLIKPETAIINLQRSNSWSTPWDWEIIWQVLIVGFFFIGQFVLPLLVGALGINPANSSLRVKALYVLGSYLLMSAGGLTVLYLSLKSFRPLPTNWFKFKLNSNWIVWGFGGYLVAIPLVLLVSLINQQIWQGQGGSNPLLLLALQAQDKVALTIFFITASIAAPIFEEIMFRGFLLPSLTKYVSVNGAIIISGLIFAVAHLSLSEVLPLATLGVVLGFVYARSRNLLAPMLLHGLWNSGTLLSLFILGSGA